MKPPFERTTCDCANCTAGCKTMPGSLIPGDVERIAVHTGHSGDTVWILDYFLASPGAKVTMRASAAQVAMGVLLPGARYSAEMVTFRVPTIVPRQKPDGSCVFLAAAGHCTVHAVAPFGCAYHDTHLGEDEADKLGQYAVRQQIAGQKTRYGWLWKLLYDLDRRATALAVRRKAFADAVSQLG